MSAPKATSLSHSRPTSGTPPQTAGADNAPRATQQPTAATDECLPALTAESADFLERIGSTFKTGALFRLVISEKGERTFTFLTDGFESLFGVPAASVLADPSAAYRLFHPEDVAGHMWRELQSVEHDEPLASEVRMQSLVSGLRWVQFRAQPGHDTAGNRCLDGILFDVTLHKQVEDQLREMATTDSLTGLANRRHFMQSAEHELHRANRYHRPISMLMVDADHFKKVNDTYGHDVGDIVLTALARDLRQSARRQDIVARLGGEEFALLLPETPHDKAMEMAERLRERIADNQISTGTENLSITVSIGVATYTGDGDSISRLIKRADDGLYEAKQSGRNKVCSVS
ncbi:sensor domain-containing diguanylate cyclase [Desulfovibrio mangrovi]|uniref:GGDEF domain-containing protein n=1 Tax=Desulfovibrio mangrovi TaxID=2976983 RepID=UPI00224841C6|nr:sensor domain-containing diguanylate cyclase [Desulfovibrio mangrovi]UZP65958.1 sensor domain-containing diguanylate cyclase [Desulfovibrio mangrovi]